MPSSYLIKLINKYLNFTINNEELEVLENFLEEKRNKKIFKEIAATDYKLKTNHINADHKIAFYKAFQKQKQLNRLSKKKSYFYKYAAAFILLLGLGFILKQDNSANHQIEIVKSTTENQIELLLHDGSKQILAHNKFTDSIKTSSKAVIGYIRQGKLQYLEQSKNKALTFNTIKVPYGKRFSLILSDGTKVEMNSGSSLRYPVSFLQESKREVFLEGEAYFDVAKNPDNPFIVNTNNLNVKVLGTRFNISAYADDDGVYTTLEEGSLEVHSANENKLQLSPNEQSVWNKNDGSLQKKVVDISSFLAWRQGSVIFKKTKFNDIVKKLHRKYNVAIINKNSNIEDEKFTAVFENKNIEQILQYFSESYEFKFKRNKKIIIIE